MLAPEPHFRIRINRDLGWALAVDTLLHEWAHLLCWFNCPEDEPHGPEWGIAYARVYRAYIGE